MSRPGQASLVAAAADGSLWTSQLKTALQAKAPPTPVPSAVPKAELRAALEERGLVAEAEQDDDDGSSSSSDIEPRGSRQREDAASVDAVPAATVELPSRASLEAAEKAAARKAAEDEAARKAAEDEAARKAAEKAAAWKAAEDEAARKAAEEAAAWKAAEDESARKAAEKAAARKAAEDEAARKATENAAARKAAEDEAARKAAEEAAARKAAEDEAARVAAEEVAAKLAASEAEAKEASRQRALAIYRRREHRSPHDRRRSAKVKIVAEAAEASVARVNEAETQLRDESAARQAAEAELARLRSQLAQKEVEKQQERQLADSLTHQSEFRVDKSRCEPSQLASLPEPPTEVMAAGVSLTRLLRSANREEDELKLAAGRLEARLKQQGRDTRPVREMIAMAASRPIGQSSPMGQGVECEREHQLERRLGEVQGQIEREQRLRQRLVEVESQLGRSQWSGTGSKSSPEQRENDGAVWHKWSSGQLSSEVTCAEAGGSLGEQPSDGSVKPLGAGQHKAGEDLRVKRLDKIIRAFESAKVVGEERAIEQLDEQLQQVAESDRMEYLGWRLMLDASEPQAALNDPLHVLQSAERLSKVKNDILLTRSQKQTSPATASSPEAVSSVSQPNSPPPMSVVELESSDGLEEQLRAMRGTLGMLKDITVAGEHADLSQVGEEPAGGERSPAWVRREVEMWRQTWDRTRPTQRRGGSQSTQEDSSQPPPVMSHLEKQEGASPGGVRGVPPKISSIEKQQATSPGWILGVPVRLPWEKQRSDVILEEDDAWLKKEVEHWRKAWDRMEPAKHKSTSRSRDVQTKGRQLQYSTDEVGSDIGSDVTDSDSD